VKPVPALLLALALADPFARLDHTVRDAIQHARRPELEQPIHWLTNCGRPPVVFAGLAAIAFIDDVGGLVTARGTLVALLPVNLAVEVLKSAVGRVRPDGDNRRRNSSFPSSHTANAMALAWMLSRRWPRMSIPLFAFAALVGFTRMYLDRHFLSDVMVATLLGIAIPMLVTRLWPALDPARVRASAAARED